MPNHCRIRLSVVGEHNRLVEFKTAARGRHPNTGDELGSCNHHEGERPEEELCFHSLVPLPEEYSKAPYDDRSAKEAGFAAGGYEMERAAWGVKWGAYDQERPILDGNMLHYSFTCAWGTPHRLFEQVSKNWPDLTFAVSAGGEVDSPWREVWVNGVQSVIEHPIGDEPARPTQMTDEEEEAYWEAWGAWQDRVLNEHVGWAKSL